MHLRFYFILAILSEVFSLMDLI